MKSFARVTGRAAVLDRADVDTDQIIPKQFLKRIERTGWGDFCFWDWRLDQEGNPRPDFELNNPAFAGAPILLAGRNFGCGSSREHAPWSLLDYGFQVIIAPSFADIFASNCGKVGLVAIRLPADHVRKLMDAVDREHGSEMTVDLEKLEITGPEGETFPFEFDASQRHAILHGLDDVGRAILRGDAIDAFERGREAPIDTAALA